MSTRTILLAGYALSGLVLSGVAAPANAADDGDIIVVATGAPQDRDEVGQAVTIISNEMIETRQSTSLSDLLVTTPGITQSRNGGLGGLTAVRIRGGEDRHTLALIDGVRINDPTSTGGAYDFGNLLALVVDHVEVLRGPNSVPWGSEAIGGVVNISTYAPTKDLSARATAEYGYTNEVNLAANVSGTAGIFSGSVSGGYFRNDGISAYRYGTEPDGYRQYAAAGQFGIALGPDAGIDLRAYYADSRRDIDGFPPPNYTFADTPDYATIEEFTGYAGAHFNLFGEALRNRIGFTLTNVDRDNFQPDIRAEPTSLSRGLVERIEYRGDARFADALRAVFGYEHMFSRMLDGYQRQSTSSDSGFAQLIVEPIRQLSLTGGIRLDDYRTYGTKTTFAANAAWRPAQGTIVRASYAEGFKAPTLYQLFSIYGNEKLQPETARSYEVGVEQQLASNKVKLGLTIFERDTVNLIDFVSCSTNIGICENRPYGVYDNVGRARSRGVEAEADVRPVKDVLLNLNYTYVDSEDRETELPLLRRPKNSFNASIDWDTPLGVSVGTTVHAVSSSWDYDFLTFMRTRLAGYTLVDVRAAIKLGNHYELYGRIENLFNEQYEMVSGYGTTGTAGYIGIRAKL
jgi:vitamin B12 transporter